MYSEGQPVKVKKDGRWIPAKFAEVAVDQPKHIDNPGANDGRGYDADQAWVIYEDGDLAGTSGLHPISEEIGPLTSSRRQSEMRLQMIVLETQHRLDHTGLELHVKQMQEMIDEQRAGGAPVGVQSMTLSTTVVGDQIRHSSITALSVGDVPRRQEPVLDRAV